MKRRILVVDDEFDISEAIKAILEIEGYEVTCAADGREGLEELGKAPFDLALVDVMMPRVDGFEFLERSRSVRSAMPTPVVLMSAAPPARSPFELGAKEFLQKPFLLEKLLEIVRRVTKSRATVESL